jgi:hypothetical protein
MGEYIGYLRRHKEVRRPGKVKVEEKEGMRRGFEEIDPGPILSERIDCRYSSFQGS